MFNFDETNFTDDPSTKKCFVRLGARHVEMIHECSKTAIRVGERCRDSPHGRLQGTEGVRRMDDGRPTGSRRQLHDKWLVRRENIYQMACAGAPSGSGKELLGDNLSSHFTPEVILATLQNNVYLCDLPSAGRDGD